MKICTNKVCKEVNPQPLSSFYKETQHKDGLTYYCKSCCKIKAKEYVVNNPKPSWWFRDKSRRYYAREDRKAHRKEYTKWANMKIYWPNLTPRQIQRVWEQMYTKQGGLCKMCCSSEKLVVDHCHSTGKVRGLLCAICNLYLGLVEKRRGFITNAERYLAESVVA